MAIMVNKDTKVITQGITGKSGQFHTEQCIAYGSKFVGGVTPGKGGQTIFDIPIFDTVYEAKQKVIPFVRNNDTKAQETFEAKVHLEIDPNFCKLAR